MSAHLRAKIPPVELRAWRSLVPASCTDPKKRRSKTPVHCFSGREVFAILPCGLCVCSAKSRSPVARHRPRCQNIADTHCLPSRPSRGFQQLSEIVQVLPRSSQECSTALQDHPRHAKGFRGLPRCPRVLPTESKDFHGPPKALQRPSRADLPWARPRTPKTASRDLREAARRLPRATLGFPKTSKRFAIARQGLPRAFQDRRRVSNTPRDVAKVCVEDAQPLAHCARVGAGSTGIVISCMPGLEQMILLTPTSGRPWTAPIRAARLGDPPRDNQGTAWRQGVWARHGTCLRHVVAAALRSFGRMRSHGPSGRRNPCPFRSEACGFLWAHFSAHSGANGRRDAARHVVSTPPRSRCIRSFRRC